MIAVAVVLSVLPDTGYSLNVNKLDISEDLEKINVGNDSGRIEYLLSLGYNVKNTEAVTTKEKLPKIFDAVTEKYNNLQRVQGFDLKKYAGKKLEGYTYEVSSLPDGTKLGDSTYLATLIVYKNKVVGADLCCPENAKYYPLMKLF